MSEIERYNFQENESKWQKLWTDKQCFVVSESSSKPKYYVLEMFPYPSGRIHMGHVRNYTLGDVVARYQLTKGFNVLHPIGWDAFGLPAENAAIQHKLHPAQWTKDNIDSMRTQLKSMGLSYDWSREIATCEPDYYGHEQKIFLDFFKHDLAYRKESWVNWDPVDQTVLANEQVVDGRGWRSKALVEKRRLSQWFLRITKFADDLLQELENLYGWPERVVTMQRNWIGRSEGANVIFPIKGMDEEIEIFTTRPNTLFGASFCALAPNHPLADSLSKNNSALAEFIKQCNTMSTSLEDIEKAEKLGVDTGLKVIHPFDPSIELPLYVANFVLMEYGTGAIFACPAHDARDFEFAKKYSLPILPVVKPLEGEAPVDQVYEGDGIIINSSFLNGLTLDASKEKAIQKLEEMNSGSRNITYRLRDWGVSRQRYWGCPIPVIHCSACGVVPVPEAELPVVLPQEVDFSKPGNPIANHPTWKYVKCPKCKGDAERETDTFDTFFESSWYFARFCSPHAKQPFIKKAVEYWLPVDQYIGGVEHAVMHLLYARFFTRALRHCGYLDIKEPFRGMMTQGMVCHETYKSQDGKWLYPEEVTRQKDGTFIKIADRTSVIVGRSEKMSKSHNNVVDPKIIIKEYGADTARLFMLSDSPPERDLDWSESGILGAWKYINRLWHLVNKLLPYLDDNDASSSSQDLKLKRLVHRTIADCTRDIERFRFNKYIARLRELSNHIEGISDLKGCNGPILREAVEVLVQMFNPIVPHITEESWQLLGHKQLLVNHPWPVADDNLLVEDTVKIAVQVNGKLRGTIEVAKDAAEEAVKQSAHELPNVQKAIQDKKIRKVIVVANKIINIVV